MRMLILALAFLSVAAQETTLPEGHYCKRVPPGVNETKAHLCQCDYVCEQNDDGTWDYKETPACKAYCRRERCTCWPEAPCPKPGAGDHSGPDLAGKSLGKFN